MPSKPAYHSVALSEDAYTALKQLQDDIAEDLGFPPTYSQAVLHVLHKLRNDNENSLKNI
jgi:hypothetical protein